MTFIKHGNAYYNLNPDNVIKVAAGGRSCGVYFISYGSYSTGPSRDSITLPYTAEEVIEMITGVSVQEDLDRDKEWEARRRAEQEQPQNAKYYPQDSAI
jgi:hypothetical protein